MLQDVPTMLGRRYRVVERLGRGGMADVYRAEDVVLRRLVAIKIFRGGVEREQHLARFRSEVRTLAALAHPHLVALYDAGGDVAEPWCAMEYIDGGSLADREGPLPPLAVARIGEQIASGLAYVHSRGIVHRDVKPSNVLLDRGGDAFLSDFGIAKLVDGTRMTQSGLMIGTAAFLSPEQVRGRPAGPAADVYALGLVLLEALTGHREYPGTPVESAVARLSRPPEVPPELGSEWVELLSAMTAEDAEKRPLPEAAAADLRAVALRLAALGLPDDAGIQRSPAGGLSIDSPTPDAVSEVMAKVMAKVGAAGTVGSVSEPLTPGHPLAVESPRAITPMPPPGVPPRNLLAWLSPGRRRRFGVALAGAGLAVGLTLAIPLLDGRRLVPGAVQVNSASGEVDQPTSGAEPSAAAGAEGNGQLQIRKAPVGGLSLPVEDRPTTPVVRYEPREPRVAGVATTRVTPTTSRHVAKPTPTPTPTRTPTPTPTPSSPSPTVSVPTSISPTPTPSFTVGGTPAASAVTPTGSDSGGASGGFSTSATDPLTPDIASLRAALAAVSS